MNMFWIGLWVGFILGVALVVVCVILDERRNAKEEEEEEERADVRMGADGRVYSSKPPSKDDYWMENQIVDGYGFNGVPDRPTPDVDYEMKDYRGRRGTTGRALQEVKEAMGDVKKAILVALEPLFQGLFGRWLKEEELEDWEALGVPPDHVNCRCHFPPLLPPDYEEMADDAQKEYWARRSEIGK